MCLSMIVQYFSQRAVVDPSPRQVLERGRRVEDGEIFLRELLRVVVAAAADGGAPVCGLALALAGGRRDGGIKIKAESSLPKMAGSNLWR